MILNSAVVETSVIDRKREAVSVFDSNVNKIFLGTDSAASSRVGQMLSLRVEGSIQCPFKFLLVFVHHSTALAATLTVIYNSSILELNYFENASGRNFKSAFWPGEELL